MEWARTQFGTVRSENAEHEMAGQLGVRTLRRGHLRLQLSQRRIALNLGRRICGWTIIECVLLESLPCAWAYEAWILLFVLLLKLLVYGA